MFWMKKSNLIKVSQTAEGVNEQIDSFLAANGFENTLDLKELAAGLLQHDSSMKDTFDTEELAAAMRKMIHNQHLFNIIQDMKAKRKAQELEAKQQESATKDVIPKDQPNPTI